MTLGRPVYHLVGDPLVVLSNQRPGPVESDLSAKGPDDEGQHLPRNLARQEDDEPLKQAAADGVLVATVHARRATGESFGLAALLLGLPLLVLVLLLLFLLLKLHVVVARVDLQLLLLRVVLALDGGLAAGLELVL